MVPANIIRLIREKGLKHCTVAEQAGLYGDRKALDQTLGYTSENIRQRIDARLAWLAAMPDEERAAYLRRTMYPVPLDFTEEIDGTTYAVNAVFNDRSDVTIQEKAERLIVSQQKE